MDLKSICIVVMISLCSCQEKQKNKNEVYSEKNKRDSTGDSNSVNTEDMVSSPKMYSNARFKEVTIERTGDHQFTIQGNGQIFEASFSWVVEDGHEELLKGFEMTDAGAPEWGKFKFAIEVEKKRPNSTLTLILFETSAMDGSRQYELPMVLE